jgi:hypothetical protein
LRAGQIDGAAAERLVADHADVEHDGSGGEHAKR